MIINHNMGASNAIRQMGVNQTNANKSMEKLSSGLKINKAGDDAAGLAISEKMRGQIRGLDQASSNAQDGISLIQTAEGALSETTSILQRMRELAVQGSNDTNTTDDRTQIQKEMNQLTSEISRIGNNTEFNTQKLLKGGTAAGDGAITDVESKAGEGTPTDIKGFTKFTISTSLKSGDTIKVAEKTITSYADDAARKAANNGLGDAYGVLETDTAEDQAKDIEKMTFDKFDVAINGATVTLTQKTAETADIAKAEIKNRAAEATTSFTFQIGANEGQQFTATISDMRSAALGLAGTGAEFITGLENDLSDVSTNGEHALDISTADAATAAITIIDKATSTVSAERAKLGAYSNRLEHTIANLGTSSENLTSAESRIRDVNMAKEMSTFSKNNILSQAAQAMLAQANQQPQQVLQLLR